MRSTGWRSAYPRAAWPGGVRNRLPSDQRSAISGCCTFIAPQGTIDHPFPHVPMHPYALAFVSFLVASTLVVDPGAAISTLRQRNVTSEPGRPVVLIVHGRGQIGHDSAQVRREALEALRAGAFEASGDSLFEKRDVRLIWYADVLDSRWTGDNASRCRSLGGSELAGADTVKTALSFIASLAGAIVELANDQKVGNDDVNELRGIVGDLRYLGDTDTRCAAEGRVGRAIEQARGERRPVILVAHSLGALVSWGALRQRGSDGVTVERFVTLGSPLGSPDVRRLVFGEDAPELSLPKSVRSWVNVVDGDDPFATRILRSAADSGLRGVIRDVVTKVRHEDAHRMSEYLRDPATADAMVSAWRTLSK